jgi:hypothetical protein
VTAGYGRDWIMGIFERVEEIVFIKPKGTRMTRRDMKGTPQIAEYATPSIWGNPTVICVGSNAGV